MLAGKISATDHILSFTPKDDSYFYETFPCQAASRIGFSGLQFTVRGPKGGSLRLELQSVPSCGAQVSYTSKYTRVSDLTGETQIITLPWTSWPGADGNAIVGVVWYGFSGSNFTWEVSNVRFVCGEAPTVAPVSPSTSSSSLASMPTVVVPKIAGSPSMERCTNLLVEDFMSQSRLTFLNYNAMLQPSSDDGTMKSVTVGSPTPNRATLTPNNKQSYWFTQMNCTQALGKYGGISMRIMAPAGATFIIQLGYKKNCGDKDPITIDATTPSLGWIFDGTEKLYSLKFSQIPGLDASKLSTLLIAGLSSPISLGPISLYCGERPSEYIVPVVDKSSKAASATIAAPAGTAPPFVIDTFARRDSNALGFYRGADDAMRLTWGPNQLKIVSPDPDYSLYTQVSATCRDMRPYEGDYLHISYTGSTAFSIALQQHNSQCNENIAPYPETWDEVEAIRYASNGDIYIPLSHFHIDKSRVIGIAIKSFYSTSPTTLKLVEIVPSIPSTVHMLPKLPTGRLIFSCTRPNSFAFCIDDGDPALAQEVMKIVREENIKVTFFTVGAPLMDPSTNLSAVYHEMLAAGHQIALHSYTHPKMEGLRDYGAIDWEFNNDLSVVAQVFGNKFTPYFRPPFGTEGARTRYRWAVASGRDDAAVVNWSVDVEDWLWAMGNTPEKQLEAFKRDVDKGGNLVVMHYLYKSTVGYLREFIRYAKASGKQMMRLDQCLMDPK
jgi:peptidoglycan/xylan/chitin deacetylase (PgdA/CDA1 family)